MEKHNLDRHYSKKTSKKHKVWQYIRRNRFFTFIDLMMASGVTENYLKTILWHLEKAGYIRQKNEELINKKRTYIHCMSRTFGVKSPSIVNGIVYDLNTNEEFDVRPKLTIHKMLEIMNVNTLLTKEEIATFAKVHPRAAKKYYKRLEDVGAISVALLDQTTKTKSHAKYQRRDGKKLFHINTKVVARLFRNVELEVEDIWKL